MRKELDGRWQRMETLFDRAEAGQGLGVPECGYGYRYKYNYNPLIRLLRALMWLEVQI